jgi:hypothetical protein
MDGRVDPASSARRNARLAGFLYLVVIVLATFAPFAVAPSAISADPATTASKIFQAQAAYRLGGVAEALVLVCDVAIAALLYQLLKPVSATLAVVAAFFRLAYVGIAGANVVLHFAALLLPIGGGPAAGVPLATAMTRLHLLGFDVALIFFGVHVALIGYLIFRSRYLPRIIGALLVVAGPAYLINSFASLLMPGALRGVAPYVLAPAGVAEVAITLWLLIAGVNSRLWNEAAERAPR